MILRTAMSVGLLVVAHEALLNNAERPALLLLGGAMIGLPLMLPEPVAEKPVELDPLDKQWLDYHYYLAGEE